ncbi:MAG TPA: alpha/beta hydrolase [Candidatus Gallacutalibacter stercoravium]|nr:alpha/beta hydrolase [Candidatus Gallacutalibacter stercoravium]
MYDISKNPMSRPFEFDGPKDHGVLVLHGFTATPGTVLPLGRAIAQSGHYVRGILLPGHGTCVEDMAATRWQQWLGAAQQAFDDMRRSCRHVSVVGLSMGGTLTLLLAESRPVYRAVPIAAALKVWDWRSHFAPLLWRLCPYPTVSGHKKTPHNFLAEYNVCYPCTPLRSVVDMNQMMRVARQGLKRITCPLLAVQAGKDETVHPDSAKWILLQTKSRYKKLLVLKNSPHVCTLGCERELLFRRVCHFLGSNPGETSCLKNKSKINKGADLS